MLAWYRTRTLILKGILTEVGCIWMMLVLSLFVRNFRDFLNNFDKIWLQIEHSLAAYSYLSFDANISSTPMANNDLLEIQQQRVDNAKSIIVSHLNINSIRTKFILAESIVKAFDLFLISKLDSTFPMNQFHILGFKVFRWDRNQFNFIHKWIYSMQASKWPSYFF